MWAETLRLDAVGPNDDFFELGGYSMTAATALARLGNELACDLPSHALFMAPTPAEMAELIVELRANSTFMPSAGTTPFVPGWVVPLQREGSRWPIFDFPLSHNELRALTQDALIAALVGRDHPFWGFQGDHPELERIRENGVPALAAAYVEQMRVIQGEGPYLLFANCGGGYLAWDVARQLLAAGDTIAGILFFEVPLRSDFDTVLPGHTPAGASNPWRLTRDYRPDRLQTDLTFLMTEDWHARGWWQPWQRVTRGRFESVVMPLPDARAPDFLERRAQTIAGHVRDWIARAEARVAGV